MRFLDLLILTWLGVITLYLLNTPFKLLVDTTL